MSVSIYRLALFFIAMVLVSGCRPTVSGEPTPHIADNERLLQQSVCATDGSGSKTAFFMTISGGGSRAALFGAHVLSELRQVDGDDLAAHIDAISGVSGGAMAAALYGISREAGQGEAWRPVWNDRLIDDRLAANLKISAARQFLNPLFLGSYIFGHKNRTDALFAALDSAVYDLPASQQTLTLGDMNTARPQIIINSTVATQDDSDAFRPRPFGSLFTFTPSDLNSIGVDYASMPVSHAVGASAAFPGMMSPVVLNRFNLGSTEKIRGETKYLHLIDGGAADNLGLLAVKKALIEDSHRVLTQCDQVIVLTVDAFGLQGEHPDDTPDLRSPLGLFIDSNTLLSAFDSLLAASRTRVLAEFKSRMFTPPADSQQCRKDGFSIKDCSGGVRVDWDRVNALLKQKLFFVHLSFDSDEVANVPLVRFYQGDDAQGHLSQNDDSPINPYLYRQEVRALRARLKRIPTTFGLPPENVADITAFTRLLFTPENRCLLHMRDLLLRGARHSADFYNNASHSCDETTSFTGTEEQLSRSRSMDEAIGDMIPGSESASFRKSLQAPEQGETFATAEEREQFWNKVLMRYGWNGSENKH